MVGSKAREATLTGHDLDLYCPLRQISKQDKRKAGKVTKLQKGEYPKKRLAVSQNLQVELC